MNELKNQIRELTKEKYPEIEKSENKNIEQISKILEQVNQILISLDKLLREYAINNLKIEDKPNE